MKKFSVLIGIAALSLMLAGPAPGDMILDTGPNPNYNVGYLLANSQWLAGKFTTTQAWNVGAMQGDIYTTTQGEVNVSIYNGDGNFPGTLVFTKAFTSGIAGVGGWQGTTGFAGTLAAGSYWIAFEVPVGSTFYGKNGSTIAPSPPFSPMSPEVYTDNGVWTAHAGLNLAAKIEGSPVPVPGAVWLLGSGLAGLWGFRKKFRT